MGVNIMEWEKNQEGIYMRDALAVPTGAIRLVLRDGATGRIKSIEHYKNMFVTAGKNSLADALRGTTDNNKGIITYCSLGTSSTAPALGDTSLIAEIQRKLVSVRSVAANVATFATFFTTAEGNGTLREAGLHGDDASASANTGTLFCRAAINRTKSSSDTLSLSWAVTIG